MSKIKGYDPIKDKPWAQQQHFFSAICQQPPPPCEKFNCQNIDQCREKELACDAFLHYVRSHNGESINPHIRRVFVYDDETGGFKEGKDFYHHWEINATKTKYKAAMK